MAALCPAGRSLKEKMTQALLTLIVPTYNRAGFVERLLGVLEQDLADLPQVRVVVGDNASTDDTPRVVQACRARQPAWVFLRHASNLGPDENFCRCLEQVQTPYFWIMGDDDLPREGCIREVLRLLGEHRPDLLYLRSEWRPDLGGVRSRIPATATSSWRVHDRESFARAVNVWMTFISGMVVNLETLRSTPGAPDIRQYTGTSLVQLGWVLPVLMQGRTFITVRDPWILATSENTGGYKLLTVFGVNLVKVVESACGADTPVSRRILRVLLWSYLPGLLWSVRRKGVGSFADENLQEVLGQLGRFPAYPWLLRPLCRAPLPLAGLLLVAAKAWGRWHRWRYR